MDYLSGTCRSDRGFTLPEAIFRIAFMSLMLAVTVPVMGGVLRQFELRGVCQRVFSELQDARMASVAQNRRYRWEVVDQQTYQVSRFDVVNNEWTVVRTGDFRRDGRHVTVSSARPIVFSPNGSAASASIVTLSSDAGSLLVTVRTNGSILIQ